MCLPEFQKAKRILVYKAMSYECDPAFLAEEAERMGKELVYPLCAADFVLELYLPKTKDAFQKGSYGIWEPVPEACEKVEAESLDLILVPGIAFDPSCRRLGQGAGYYDRLLARSPAVRVGFGLEQQLLERVPAELHDEVLHHVITGEKRFTSLS